MIVPQTELLPVNISPKESPQGQQKEQNSLLVFTMILSALQENVSLFAYKPKKKNQQKSACTSMAAKFWKAKLCNTLSCIHGEK